MSDYCYISEKEFKELEVKAKWNYADSLHKIINELQTQADKNCSECEKYLLADHDINIDLLFEDWRECKDNCEECGEEEKLFMCRLQFDLLNHFAQEIGNLRLKLNGLAKAILKKDDTSKKILEKAISSLEKTDSGMYQ